MSPTSWCRSLRLLFLAFLLVISAAALPPPSPRMESRSPTPPAELSTADALLVRLCHPRSSREGAAPPLSPCRGLHLRRRPRHHHQHNHRPPVPVALPPPARSGEEEIDVRYGVAKRLVPTGPNPLHN